MVLPISYYLGVQMNTSPSSVRDRLAVTEASYETVCGIYYIQNTVNTLCYVGSSIDIKNRVRAHFGELLKGTHHSSKLQNAFNKYGVDSFAWGVCEEVTQDNQLLMDREQAWIDVMGHYNICKIAGSPRGVALEISNEERKRRSDQGKKLAASVTPEQRAYALGKALEAKRGVPLTDAHKAKLSAATKGRKLEGGHREKVINAMKSRIHTPESRAKLSASLKAAAASRTEEEKARWIKNLSASCMGRPSAMKGVKMSEESRKKMSDFQKGKVISEAHKEKLRQAMLAKSPEWYAARAEKIKEGRAGNKAARAAG